MPTNLLTRLLILVAAATLPAVLVLIYLQQDLRRDREARLAEEAVRLAERLNASVESVLVGARHLATAIAHGPAVRRLDPACATGLSVLRSDLSGYASLSIVNADDTLVCTTATGGRAALAPPAAMHGSMPELGRLHVGLFAPANAARGPVLPLCVPFRAENGQVAFIVMELSLDWLAGQVAQFSLPERGLAGVIDREGTVLVRLPGGIVEAGRRVPEEMRALIGRPPGTATAIALDGDERLVGHVPSGAPGAGLMVAIGLDRPTLMADIDDAAREAMLMVGLSALLSLWLALMAGERFVRRPTAALLDAARRWSTGDLGARAAISEADGSEFHRLAVAYNGMAEALGRRQAELRALNDSLEQRVQARTRDLEESRNRLQMETAERERSEAELRQVQKLQVVGQLAGGIAHDFNNLLTAIVGALDLLRRRLPAGQRHLVPLVENALNAAERGGRLISQLLAFSRRQRLLPAPTDLNISVLALAGLLGSTLGRNIRIVTELSPELWPAMVDPNQVEAMILNLAINARDAMPEGGVLTIRTRNLTLAEAGERFANAAPGEYVALTVADTGTGMNEAVQARVFEPFFTTKAQGEGAGLGLSQVHGLAVQSGGDVRIDSKPGSGTAVTVLLPRAHAPAAMQPRAADPVEQASRLPPLRVLVVDDDRAVREMTGEMLAERGHLPVLARDGSEALGIIEHAAAAGAPGFDILLADFVMPGMNGADLIAAARTVAPRLPALLVTGNAEASPAETVAPEAVMRKPFTIAQLEERMGRMLAPAPLPASGGDGG